MTETRFTWRWLLVVALVGILIGLGVGLAAGWLVFPMIGSSSIAGLAPAAQNDYIILVANTYAYDQDAARAKQRLAQLQEKDIRERVEQLAKALAVRKDPSAANVADLALALGSEDSSLQVLAASIADDSTLPENGSEPTKVARADTGSSVDPVGEQQPTEPAQEPTAAPKKKKNKPTAVPQPTEAPEPTQVQEEPTDVPATQAPAPTPQPTNPPAPAAVPITTEFIPSYPDKWWDAIKFIPAEVAPGQPYWHLKYARFCDWAPTDEFNTCEGFPGGGDGHEIWIMTVDEAGNCIETPVTDTLNDGTDFPLTPDMLKVIAYPWNPYGYACDKDYEKGMYGEGNTISVPGLPSDKITELQLCAKSPPPGYNPPPCGHAHVRYFLIFQRTTR